LSAFILPAKKGTGSANFDEIWQVVASYSSSSALENIGPKISALPSTGKTDEWANTRDAKTGTVFI